ncbi:MAG: phage head spike fiber domain-containing protein [Planctomycetota bacterium]
MRITMTSPNLARRQRFNRRWRPESHLANLLGRDLAAACVLGLLPETNGIGNARPRCGPDLTAARSSEAHWLSAADGRVHRLPADGWRTAAGIFGPATNLCLQSENLNTAPWAVGQVNPPQLDTGTPGPLGAVFKVTDPGTQAYGGLYQPLSGLADGQPHAASIFVKAGTTTGFSVGIYDATALVWRARANFNVSGSTVTWASTTAGGYRLEQLPQSSWYRITSTLSSLVAAHTNQLLVYISPPGVIQAGYLYLSGGQVQTGKLAQPYITTTNAAASRSADQLSLSTAGLTAATSLGLVTRILDHGGSPYLLYQPGTAGDANRMDVWVSPGTGLNVAIYDASAAVRTWTQNAAPTDFETAHWIVTNDNGGTVCAWKNGASIALTASGSGSGVRNALAAAMQLGRKDLTNGMQGELHACVQFNRALTTAEVGRLYAALQRLES